jgi:ComF family protein
MGARDDLALCAAGFDQAGAERGQAVAAGNGADQWRVRPERAAEQLQGKRQVVDRVECSDRHAKVIAFLAEVVAVFLDLHSAGVLREQGAGIEHNDLRRNCTEAPWPFRRWTAEQQRPSKRTRDIAQPIEAFVKGAIEQEQLGTAAGGAVTAQRAQLAVEQVAGHRRACAAANRARQEAMASVLSRPVLSVGKLLLDFALPPRCAGCAEVTDDVGAFCPACWGQMEWLGNAGCQRCGLPLAGTEIDMCARCLADPPKLDRMRAAVAYDDLPRSIVLRLKYGRKVALARTMARYMAPLRGDWGDDTLIVPVPLHRWRLWGRGFNQSGLVARELGRRWDLETDNRLLRRVKRTQPLKGLNHTQRRKAVAGAFRAIGSDRIKGRTIVLVDDVLTSGSTAEACARVLRRAGAERIELICWARVVRPAQLMR